MAASETHHHRSEDFYIVPFSVMDNNLSSYPSGFFLEVDPTSLFLRDVLPPSANTLRQGLGRQLS